jgi:hypothetical protein
MRSTSEQYRSSTLGGSQQIASRLRGTPGGAAERVNRISDLHSMAHGIMAVLVSVAHLLCEPPITLVETQTRKAIVSHGGGGGAVSGTDAAADGATIPRLGTDENRPFAMTLIKAGLDYPR